MNVVILVFFYKKLSWTNTSLTKKLCTHWFSRSCDLTEFTSLILLTVYKLIFMNFYKVNEFQSYFTPKSLLTDDKHKMRGRFCVIFRNCTTNNSITVECLWNFQTIYFTLGVFEVQSLIFISLICIQNIFE